MCRWLYHPRGCSCFDWFFVELVNVGVVCAIVVVVVVVGGDGVVDVVVGLAFARVMSSFLVSVYVLVRILCFLFFVISEAFMLALVFFLCWFHFLCLFLVGCVALVPVMVRFVDVALALFLTVVLVIVLALGLVMLRVLLLLWFCGLFISPVVFPVYVRILVFDLICVCALVVFIVCLCVVVVLVLVVVFILDVALINVIVGSLFCLFGCCFCRSCPCCDLF